MDRDASEMDLVCLVNKRKSLIIQIRQKRVQPGSFSHKDHESIKSESDSKTRGVQPRSLCFRDHVSTYAFIDDNHEYIFLIKRYTNV